MPHGYPIEITLLMSAAVLCRKTHPHEQAGKRVGPDELDAMKCIVDLFADNF